VAIVIPNARCRTLVGTIIGVLLVASIAPLAAADVAGDRATAEGLYRSGDRAYKSGLFADAAEMFEQAYDALPLPDIAFAAAQAHRLQFAIDGVRRHAHRALRFYRAYVKATGSGGRVAEAAEFIAALDPIVAAMPKEDASAPAAPTPTKLMLTSPVDGAVGGIGGERKPLPVPLVVPPGEHVVTIEAPGYEPQTRKVVAVEGSIVAVDVALTARPAALTIAVESGTRIRLDGREVGVAPLAAPLSVPAGPHLVTLTRRGRRGVAQELEVDRGEAIEIRRTLVATTQRRAVPWVLGSAGALAIASAGAGLWAWSSQRDAVAIDERRRAPGSISEAELARYDQLIARRDDLRVAGVALGALALATGLTGLALAYFDMPRAGAGAETTAPVLTPAVSPSGAGVVLAGGF
jgi:hypothetical protein